MCGERDNAWQACLWVCHMNIEESMSFDQEDKMTVANIVQVRLFRDNYPVIKCRANYLGTLGMQVESGPVFYQKGTVLEAELTLDENDLQLQCRIPVVVTQQAYNNIGLTFLNHDMLTNSHLLEIIFAFNCRESSVLN